MPETLLPPAHPQGNKYRLNNKEYILTGFIVEGVPYALLVDLKSGKTWSNPVPVDLHEELSPEELNRLVQARPHKYSITVIEEYNQ
jgi:hypothetical protein